MEKKAEYRSSLRSKQLLREAFFTLMKEKPIEKITVSDLVRKADLNRNTFYAHYQDVRALIECIEDETIQQMKETLCSPDATFMSDPYPHLMKIALYLESHLEFYQILVNSSLSDRFLGKLKHLFISFLQNDPHIPPILKNSIQFQLFCSFFAGGVTSMLQDYFNGVLQLPLEEAVASVSSMILLPPPIEHNLHPWTKNDTN